MAELPEKIGHYKIVSQLGRGGMGVVYKAREESLNRFVAIKVLTEALTEDATFLQRFVREAQAAAGLSHPNIVQIFYIGEDQGHPFFVMDYVTGRSLHSLIRQEGRIGNPRASQLILQAAHGLAAAHDQGIVHRDIKPANLMLDERGLIKIADFGLALPADAETRLTATGMLMGTPGYLAPEQCRGEKVDNRTDIYALGVTFYELLSGSLPFRGESPLALLRQILDEEPPDIATLNPDLDAETRRILQKMIAKDRTLRYQDCHQIISDLEDYLSSRGVRSMTAGLSTRKLSTAPGAAVATEQAAATEVLAARTDKGSPFLPAQDTPTAVITSGAAATLPNVAGMAPATLIQGVPAGQPATPQGAISSRDTMVSQPHPPGAMPPAAARRSSTMPIVVVLLLLLIGGGSAAAFFAMKIFAGRKSAAVATTSSSPLQTDSASPSAAATVPDPGRPAVNGITDSRTSSNILLNQPVDTARLGGKTQAAVPTATDQRASQPAAAPDEVSRPARPAQSVAGRESSRPVSGPSTLPATVAARSTIRIQEPVARPAASALKGVAVAVTGDEALTGPIASVLTSELSAAGLDATDAESLPSTEALVRGGSASAGRLIERLRAEGMAVLLLARVDPAGERQLNYLGTTETAYSARVTLTTYDLATGKPFGSRSSATIEYTSKTAEREAEKIIGRLARKTAEAIQNR